jgi:hypothetical protein
MLPDISMEATSPDPHGQPVFDTKCPHLVHQSGSLPNKPVTESTQSLQINLFCNRSVGTACLISG